LRPLGTLVKIERSLNEVLCTMADEVGDGPQYKAKGATPAEALARMAYAALSATVGE